MMVAAAVDVQGMSLEEFIYLSETQGEFELMDGERIPRMATKKRHSIILTNLLQALLTYMFQTHIGRFFPETTYILPEAYTSRWVKDARIPDILFYAAQRLADYEASIPDSDDKPFMLIPDLVVEILSDNDTFVEITEKVAMYQADGVKIIWVVDPKAKKVAVYSPSEPLKILGSADSLTAPDLLPDFALPLAELF